MSSSSNDNLPDQYWYPGAQDFRDASDLTEFKKRRAFFQVKGENVRPDITQSLQNRLSYQFGYIGCTGGSGSTGGGFPNNTSLF